MAWFGDTFGDGLSSIKGQITKITKEVLSEDPLGASSFEGRVKELENEIQQLKIRHSQELEARLNQMQQDSNKTIDDLEAEHEAALQIIIGERDDLKRILNDTGANSNKNSHELPLETQAKDSSSNQVKRLKNELAKKQQEITAKHKETIKLQQELNAKTAELQSNQEILNDFNDRLDSSEQEAKKLYEQLLSKEEEIRNLEAKQNEVVLEKSAIGDTELQLEHAESLIKGLMEELDKSRDIQLAFDNLTKENDELKARLNTLEDCAQISESQMEAELVLKTLELRKESEMVKEELENQLVQKEKRIEELLFKQKAAVDDLAKIEELESKLTKSTTHQMALEDKLEQKNKEINSLKEDMSQKLDDSELQVVRKESRNSMMALEELIKQKDSEIIELRAKLLAQQQDETNQNAEINSLKEESKNIQLAFERSLTEKDGEITDLRESLTSQESKVYDMEKQYKTLKTRLEECEVAKTELEHNLQEMCNKCSELERENNDHKKENAMEVSSQNIEAFQKFERTVENLAEMTENNRGLERIVEELTAKVATASSELNENRKKLDEVQQIAEALQIKNEVLKHNLVKLEEQKTQLVQEMSDRASQSEKQIEELKNAKSELTKKLDESVKENSVLCKENKEMREKVEKLGFGVLAGLFEVQFKKLEQLAQRMLPTASSAESGASETEPTNHQSQTDDVKRLRQDLNSMTANIQVVENGLNALQSNINQWAAAVQSRDDLILSLQSQIAETEGSKSQLETKCEELKKESAEWEHRVRELQALYETDVGRLEKLSIEKENLIPNLENEDNVESSSPQLSDQVTRLVSENSDLKELVQQLRSNMLELNTRNTAQNQQRLSPTPSIPNSNQVPVAQYQALKEKETSLSKELERLRAHLVEVEEHYTTEAMTNETEIADLRAKLSIADEQLRNSTTVYKSANIRATQHVDALNSQIQLITVQRNDLQAKLSEAEDQTQKQAASLTSLQSVLEQFQLDKQRELLATEERHKYYIQLEKRRVAEVEDEVMALKKQLAEANNGLKAASRLGEQLDHKMKLLTDRENELMNAQQQLLSAQSQLNNLNEATAGKIDKSLVKNLVVGYLGANGEAKTQALRILTAVLELSEGERVQAGIQGREGGWLSSLLHPSPNNSTPTSESLSQAFVRFLENESRPQPQLRLLPEASTDGNSRDAPKRTPLVLSELVLPTVTPTSVSDHSLNGVFNDS